MITLGNHANTRYNVLTDLRRAFGVMWLPDGARHRSIPPKPTAPRHRWPGTGVRRGRARGKHAIPRGVLAGTAAAMASGSG